MNGSAQSSAQPIGPSNLSLQASLHAATRSKHANLNRTITSRLPLGLPPNATSPLLYHLGMLAFGSIYHELEQSIADVLQEPHLNTSLYEDRHRHVQIIEGLFTEGLARSQQFTQDAETLRRRLLHTPHFAFGATNSLRKIEACVEKQARICTAPLHERIKDRPYLALAYAWAMYLALFNGGRYLLKQLESAGPEFWLEDSQTEPHTITALSFWHFDAATTQDPNADQLKITFKQNFDAASSMLTDGEFTEVVNEGSAVFDLCGELIDVLDSSIPQLGFVLTMQQPQMDATASATGESALQVWQTLESVILGPAYEMIRHIWSRSFRRDASIAAG